MSIGTEAKTLYDLLGQRPTLERVHKIFYDKIYADSWLGLFFKEIKQQLIEDQQTDFMTQAMGGPEKYLGKFPIPAHKHMFITEELFAHRHQLLQEALIEAGVPKNLQERWLKIDGAFKTALLKKSLSDCEKRYHTDEILSFPDPRKRAA